MWDRAKEDPYTAVASAPVSDFKRLEREMKQKQSEGGDGDGVLVVGWRELANAVEKGMSKNAEMSWSFVQFGFSGEREVDSDGLVQEDASVDDKSGEKAGDDKSADEKSQKSAEGSGEKAGEPAGKKSEKSESEKPVRNPEEKDGKPITIADQKSAMCFVGKDKEIPKKFKLFFPNYHKFWIVLDGKVLASAVSAGLVGKDASSTSSFLEERNKDWLKKDDKKKLTYGDIRKFILDSASSVSNKLNAVQLTQPPKKPPTEEKETTIPTKEPTSTKEPTKETSVTPVTPVVKPTANATEEEEDEDEETEGAARSGHKSKEKKEKTKKKKHASGDSSTDMMTITLILVGVTFITMFGICCIWVMFLFFRDPDSGHGHREVIVVQGGQAQGYEEGGEEGGEEQEEGHEEGSYEPQGGEQVEFEQEEHQEQQEVEEGGNEGGEEEVGGADEGEAGEEAPDEQAAPEEAADGDQAPAEEGAEGEQQ